MTNAQSTKLILSYIDEIIQIYTYLDENRIENILIHTEIEAADQDNNDISFFVDESYITTFNQLDQINIKSANDFLDEEFKAQDINNSEYLGWRMTEDGQKLERTNRIVNLVQTKAEAMEKSEYDPQKAVEEFTCINNEISLINNPDLEEVKEQVSNIISLAQQATDKFDLHTKTTAHIKKIIITIPIIKKKGKKKLGKLKKKAEQQIDTSIQTVVTYLVSLSNYEEKIKDELINDLTAVKAYCEDPNKLIEDINKASLDFTRTANEVSQKKSVIDAKKDLMERINGFEAVISHTKQIFDDAISNRAQIFDIQNYQGQIQSTYSSLLAFLQKFEDLEEDGLVYLGDHKPANEALLQFNAMVVSLQMVLANDITKENDKRLLEYTKRTLTISDTKLRQLIIPLDQNKFNEIARTEILHILQNVSYATKLAVDLLKSKEMQALNSINVSTALQMVTEARKNIIKAIRYISVIQVTYDSINSFIKAVNEFIELYSELNSEATKSLSPDQISKKDTTIKELESNVKSLSKHVSSIKKLPSYGKHLKSSQKYIYTIVTYAEDFKDVNDIIGKSGEKGLFTKKLNNIIKKADACLIEVQSSEDMSTCMHVAKFQQVQLEFAQLLGEMKTTSDIPEVDNSKELSKKLRHLTSDFSTCYVNQLEARKSLRKRPYFEECITYAKEVAINAKEITEKAKETAELITSQAKNDQFQKALEKTNKAAEIAVSALEKAPIGKFTKPLDQETIERMEEDIDVICEIILAIAPSEEVSINEELVMKLDANMDIFDKTLPIIKKFVNTPSQEFFNVANNLKNVIIETKELLSSLAIFNENEEFVRIFETVSNNMESAVIDLPPNLNIAKKLSKECDDKIKEIIALIKEVLQSQELRANPAGLSIVNDIFETFDFSEFVINKNIGKKFNLDNARIIKETLLEIASKTRIIQPTLRTAMKQNINKYSKLISSLNSSSAVAISCMRLISDEDSITVNTDIITSFSKKLSIDDQIKKAADQIKCLDENIQNLMNEPQLADKKSILDILAVMHKHLENTDYKQFTNESNAKKIIEELKILISKLPLIIKQAPLVTRVINNESFLKATNTVNSNINDLHHILTTPHITQKTAPQYVKGVEPLMQNALVSISTMLDAAKKLNNSKLLSSLQDLYKHINQNKKLDPKDISSLQSFADTLCTDLGASIRFVSDIPELDQYVDSLVDLYKFDEKYTGVVKIDLKFTNSLLVKNVAFKDQVIFTAFVTACNIGIQQEEAGQNLFIPVVDFLNKIHSRPGQMPHYLYNALNLVYEPLRNRRFEHAFDAARVISMFGQKQSSKVQMADGLVVKTAQKLATLFNTINDQINSFKEQTRVIGAELTPELSYYIDHITFMIKNPTISEIAKGGKSQTASDMFEEFFIISMYLNILVKYTRTLPQFVQQIETIVPNIVTIMTILTQEELAFVSYFFSFLDTICIKLEELCSLCTEGQSTPEIAKPVYTNLLPILKDKNRLIRTDAYTLNDVAKQFIDFRDTVFPKITKEIPRNAIIEAISNAILSITPLTSVINFWARSNSDNKQKIALRLQINAASICNSVSVAYQAIRAKPENFIFVFSCVNMFLTKLSFYANEPKHKNTLTKLIPDIKTACDIAQSINNSQQQEQSVILSNLLKINELLDKTYKSAKSIAELNYELLGASEENVNAGESLLKNIKNPLFMGIAQRAVELIKQMKNSSGKEVDTTMKKKKSKGKLSKASSTVKQSISNNSLALTENVQPLATICESMASVPNSVFTQELPRVIRGNPNKILPFTTVTQDNLNCGTRRSIIAQRFQYLMLQQNILFPDVTTIDIPDEIKPEEINKAFDSIKIQLDAFADPVKLVEIQQNLTTDEICTQRNILSSCAEMVMSEAIDISFEETRLQTFEDQAAVLGRVVSSAAAEGQCPPVYDQLENNRNISRCCSVALLAQQLRATHIALIEGSPDIYKFILSSEGAEANTEPIPIDSIANAQKQIKKEIELLKSPDYFLSFVLSIDIILSIYQLRVLINMIEIITGPFGNKLVSSVKEDPTIESLFDKLAEEQLTRSRADASAISPAAMLNLQATAKAQENLCITIDRIELAEMLHVLQIHQALLAKFTNEVKSEPMRKVVANRAFASISNQLKEINHPQHLKTIVSKLTKNQVQEQQQILKQVISLLTVDDSIEAIEATLDLKSPQTLNTQCHATLESLHKIVESCSTYLQNRPKSGEIGGISSMQNAVESITRVNELALLFSKFTLKYPSAVQSYQTEKGVDELKQAMKPEIFEETRKNVNSVARSITKFPEFLDQYVNSLTKQGQVVFYGILLFELEKLQKEAGIRFNSEEFDAATLSQISSERDICVDQYDLQLASVDKDSTRETIIQNKVSELLLRTIDIHNELVPIKNSNDLEADLQAFQALSNEEIIQQLQSINEQIKMPVTEVRKTISAMKPEYIIAQNAIISFIADQISQSEDIINIESSKRISEDEAAIEVINQLIANVQSVALEKQEKIIAATRLNPYTTKINLNKSKEVIARSSLSLSLQNIKSSLMTSDLQKFLRSEKGNAATTTPFKKEELIQRQMTLRKMIGGEPSFVAKSMTQYDIARTLIVAHDLISQLEVEPTHPEIPLTLEDLGSRYETKAPTYDESVSTIIQAATNVIKSISTNQEINPEYCTKLVVSDMQRVLPILREMVISPGTWTPNAGIVIDTTASIIGLLTVIIPTLPQNLRSVLPNDTSSILDNLKIIEMNASDLNDQTTKQEFTNATRELYNEIYSFYAAISNEPIGVATDTIQSIAESIENKEYPNISALIAKLNAIKVSNIAQARKFTLIEQVSPIINDISNIVISPTISSSNVKLLKASKGALLSALDKTATNPFQILSTIKTVDGVKESLTETIQRIKEEFVSLEVHSSKAKKIQKVSSILSNVSIGMSAAFKGLRIKKFESSAAFAQTLSEWNNVVETSEEMLSRSAWTPISVKNYQRKLIRIIEKTIEIIDTQKDAYKVENEVDKRSGEVAKEIGTLLESVCCATATFTSAKSSDAYTSIVGDAMTSANPLLKAAELLSNLTSTTAYVTNSQRVNLLYDRIKEKYSSSDHDIYAAVDALNDFTKSSVAMLSAKPVPTVQAKDIVVKVPSQIQIPEITQESAAEDLSKMNGEVQSIIDSCSKATISGDSGALTKNFTLAKQLIENIIQVSIAKATKTAKPQVLEDISLICMKIHSLFSKVLINVRTKTVSAKCDISQECEQITAALKELDSTLQKELTTEQSLPSIVSSLIAADEKLIPYREKIRKTTLGETQKQCLSLLLEICVSTISSIILAINSAISKIDDKDPIISFAKKVVKEVDNLIQTIEGCIKEPSNVIKLIQERAEEISKLINEVTTQAKESAALTPKIVESLTKFGNNSTIVAKKIEQKKESQKAAKANPIEANNRLLERLQYEANVIKARKEHQRLEKRLQEMQ